MLYRVALLQDFDRTAHFLDLEGPEKITFNDIAKWERHVNDRCRHISFTIMSWSPIHQEKI
jgi:hypothetical protein